MTHDELLAKLSPARYIIKDEVVAQLNALRAVVEEHEPGEPYNSSGWRACLSCSCQDFNTITVYPCPTIQAIEKELE